MKMWKNSCIVNFIGTRTLLKIFLASNGQLPVDLSLVYCNPGPHVEGEEETSLIVFETRDRLLEISEANNWGLIPDQVIDIPADMVLSDGCMATRLIEGCNHDNWYGCCIPSMRNSFESGRSDIMDVKKAAVYLGISERKLNSLISDRDIPYARIGRLVKLYRPSIDCWLMRGGTVFSNHS